MVYCSVCGKELAEGARFCKFCGSPARQDAAGDEAELERRARTYEPQVLSYAAAARRMLCKPVKEVILFFLSAQRAWSIAVDDRLLRQTEEQIVAGA